MQRFQELLTQAAQLKESQLKNQRKNYQSLPDYIKAGLNYAKKFEILRKQNFLIQMNMSEKLKKQGNNLFKNQQYDQGLSKYEQALSIFRYIASKSYENMKDEDLEYFQFSLNQIQKKYEQEYQNHLLALYLNICSCLTKKNKKDDAIHAADQALKIKETAKAYYKKAQAYLQFINREAPDIKLGFYYLNKCYQLSKDPTIVQEMHKIKKQLEEERTKEKTWFKFMFDKNSQNQLKNNKSQKSKQIQEIKQQKKTDYLNQKIKKLQQEKIGQNQQKEDQKLQKTKQKLAKYLNLDLKDEVWLECYQGQFISKNGSKIYSIIQLYGYKDFLGEYRALLAHSLELKKQGSVESRRQAYRKYFQWLKSHPIDQINKYLQRYELQTKWIREQRNKLTKERDQQNQKVFKNQHKEIIQNDVNTQQLKQQKKQTIQQIVQQSEQVKKQQYGQTEIETNSIDKQQQFIDKVNQETKTQQTTNKGEQNFKKMNDSQKTRKRVKYLAFALVLVIFIAIITMEI